MLKLQLCYRDLALSPSHLKEKSTNYNFKFLFKKLFNIASKAATRGVLRNFTKFTGNTCARVSFLIKLHASALQLY